MARLTERDEFGNVDIVGAYMLQRDLELDFTELNLVTEALNKLARLEDLEEIFPEMIDSLQAEADGMAEYYDKPKDLSYGAGFEDGLLRAILRMKVTLGIKIT